MTKRASLGRPCLYHTSALRFDDRDGPPMEERPPRHRCGRMGSVGACASIRCRSNKPVCQCEPIRRTSIETNRLHATLRSHQPRVGRRPVSRDRLRGSVQSDPVRVRGWLAPRSGPCTSRPPSRPGTTFPWATCVRSNPSGRKMPNGPCTERPRSSSDFLSPCPPPPSSRARRAIRKPSSSMVSSRQPKPEAFTMSPWSSPRRRPG